MDTLARDTSGRTVLDVQLDGGHLALDFANTVGGLRDDPPSPEEELLESYEDLVRWAARVGLVSEREARALAQAAAHDDRAAQRAVRRAVEVRELVYGVFRAIADGGEPLPAHLERLRDAERQALASARLEPAGGAMRWTWPAPSELTDPLGPIVHAAVELLTNGPLDRVRTCANCRWLFLDQSRNRSRRWCSMGECGTQLKHKRFVERRRRQSARR